jgi:hypothetical protein
MDIGKIDICGYLPAGRRVGYLWILKYGGNRGNDIGGYWIFMDIRM